MTRKDQVLKAFREHLIETGNSEMAELSDDKLVEALKTAWPKISAEKRKELH